MRYCICIPKVSSEGVLCENRLCLELLSKIIIFRSGRRQALRQEAEFIQGYVPSGKFLDVGCSSGDFFEFFPQPIWERYGVELSSSAAAYTAQAYTAQVFAGTLRSANWPGEFFDLVSMIDMLYYVDDPRG